MEPDGASPLFEGRYRNESARCAPWDYASSGAYFVTINTKDRIPWFGTVRNGFMHLSAIGNIVDECWRAIPLHHDDVSLDAHIVMPDHVHGIIILHPRLRHPGPTTNRFGPLPPGSLPAVIGSFKSACTRYIRRGRRDAACRVPTTIPPPMDVPGPTTIPLRTPPGPGPTTSFAWQPRYHDRVIRDETALRRIRVYIRDNPRRWWTMGRGGL